MARSPQTLSIEDRRALASWAADCAEHVLTIYEDAVPGDARVRTAIAQARAFAVGELDAKDAVQRRGGQAGAAAREAPTPAARAAAYAAEQAAAVAHMGAHALGAAGYAAKASTLAAGFDDDTVTEAEARRQVAGMTRDAARALASLPPLGENRSGPLASGRLSSGHVGATIRAIQAALRERCSPADTAPIRRSGSRPLEHSGATERRPSPSIGTPLGVGGAVRPPPHRSWGGGVRSSGEAGADGSGAELQVSGDVDGHAVGIDE